MRKKRIKRTEAPGQLELPLESSATREPPPSGLWAAVDGLPEAIRLAHLRRRKLLPPKLRQPALLPGDSAEEGLRQLSISQPSKPVA